MRIELMINKLNLSETHFTKIDEEFTRRVLAVWPDVNVRVRLGGNNDLSVLGCLSDEKERVESLLQEMFDEADEWLYNDIDMY
ncbi:DinI-like family protein [Photobacterium leiognathi]|uniref:DinI-like family protein n=1 Tax=Photobacterium leiognathi TaxID=553611 RepID=UPI00076A88BE|nr:DinI-like family protein [Photobacterium leiognathi]